MNPKQDQPTPENAPRHINGEPATIDTDPAQVDPTGGAGLLDPANDPLRDIGPIEPDRADPPD